MLQTLYWDWFYPSFPMATKEIETNPLKLDASITRPVASDQNIDRTSECTFKISMYILVIRHQHLLYKHTQEQSTNSVKVIYLIKSWWTMAMYSFQWYNRQPNWSVQYLYTCLSTVVILQPLWFIYKVHNAYNSSCWRQLNWCNVWKTAAIILFCHNTRFVITLL